MLDLVGRVYDAAGDPTRWPAFLDRLASVFKSTGSTFYAYDFARANGTIAATFGFDAAYLRSYYAYYAPKNVYMIRGEKLLVPGTVCRSEALCPDQEAVRTEFYNDWIAPQRQRYGVNAVLARKGSLVSLLGLVRAPKVPMFADYDLVFLRTLLPHLQRAVQLHQKITRLETENQAASDALNRWPTGVILFDDTGQILLMNRAAESILNQHDGLTSNKGKLETGTAHKTALLHHLIRCATQTAAGLDRDPGGALLLSRPSGKRALQVLVAPACASQTLFPFPAATAAVFITDPEADGLLGEDVLRQLYGLSRAEAGVTALLLQGKDLTEVSDELRVSRETTRTHLKHIFEKTGTRRQTDLMRLLLRSPAGILIKNHPFG
jgi:DNA-binding CsgD family transcriptional regulator/PAS domain-containing protein